MGHSVEPAAALTISTAGRKQRATCFGFLVGMVTLVGLVAQLLLQGFTLPDETPRAAIQRLTGIDISPQSAPQPDMPMMDMPMSMAEHHQHHHHQDHRHGKSCPLCPLLILVVVILAGLPVLPACAFCRYQLEMQPHAARAPPGLLTGLPPSRGPPVLV